MGTAQIALQIALRIWRFPRQSSPQAGSDTASWAPPARPPVGHWHGVASAGPGSPSPVIASVVDVPVPVFTLPEDGTRASTRGRTGAEMAGSGYLRYR